MPAIGAVVVAAGSSSRMGGVDKIFATVAARPLFIHSLAAFQACEAVDQTVLVTAAERVAEARELAAQFGIGKLIAVCSGGPRRQDSVRAGLEQFGRLRMVLVHDAARPLVTATLIESGIRAGSATGAAVAAVPVVDTLKEVGPDGTLIRTVDRSALWAVQTPQVFDFDLLLSAHRAWPGDVTDDAMLLEALGHRVTIFPGSSRNIKVTSPDDMLVAEALLRAGP